MRWLPWAVILFCSSAWAGNVRTVETDGSKMLPIYLRMGQSTVLRFQEKPKKVILGNSNYYAVEFVDNDVALQPQGGIATNLFVYGQKYVYGFLLRPATDGYDDLVQIHWKDPIPAPVLKPAVLVSPIHELSRPNLSFLVGKSMRAIVRRIQRYAGKGFYLIDIDLKNESKSEVSLSDLRMAISLCGKSLSPQEFVKRDSTLKPDQSTAVRLIVNLNKKSDVTLNVGLGKVVSHQTIYRKYF